MPGKCCFFCLEWIMEYFFPSYCPTLELGFVKHFVYLCYVAVHGTNMITCLLQLTAKVHMYKVVLYDENMSEASLYWGCLFCQSFTLMQKKPKDLLHLFSYLLFLFFSERLCLTSSLKGQRVLVACNDHVGI